MPRASPRIIHIPLLGGDRKAQAKGIRYAHGIHASHYREFVLIRSADEANNPEIDQKGTRRVRFHQHLNEDYGVEKLKRQIWEILTRMKVSDTVGPIQEIVFPPFSAGR